MEIDANGQETANPLGTSGPFVVVKDFGFISEEKILCSSISGSTLVVWTDGTRNGRGYDGTIISASSATVGDAAALVFPVATSVENLQFNASVISLTSGLSTETTRAEAAEALLAPLASAALTGSPTAPTKPPLTNNTDIATAAYTDLAVGVETTRATTAEGTKFTTSTSLGGDLTGTLPNPTLATVGTPGTHGSSSTVPVFTVDSKGRVSADTDTAIQITESQVTSLTSDLALKAPLASPSLTGVPIAPTAVSGTNTTQLATTAFDTAAVLVETNRAETAEATKFTTATSLGGDLTGTLPNPTLGTAGTAGTYGDASHIPVLTTDTKGRVTVVTPTSIQITESEVTGLTSDLALKAPLASPALTGAPTAPTQVPLTGNTDIATTAYADLAVGVETSRAGTAETTKFTTSTSLGGDLTGTLPNPSLKATGTAGTYGDASHYPVLTTDAQGRVTAVTTDALPTSLPPSGTAGGDLTGTYPNPTLAAVATAGTTGDASHVAAVTIDAKGRVTTATATSIQIAESQVTSLTSDLSLKAPLASPTFTGTVTVPSTVNPTDAASKSYVDATAQGLSIKASCQEATAAALPTNTYLAGVITITATGVLTVDGVSVALNDRVLVKNEVTGANNGIYLCTTAGSIGVAAVLTRATDSNTSAEIVGAFTFIETGTVNANAGFVNTNSGTVTIGTTAITYTQFSGAGEITAGTGLSKSANTLSVTGVIGAGSVGSAVLVPVITYNAQGQITGVTTAAPSDATKLPLTQKNAASGIAALDANSNVVYPIQDKGGQVFNVKAYGAKGDGVTDDTVAIQAAITACNVAGGGTVYRPSGIYIVDMATTAGSVTYALYQNSNVMFSGPGIIKLATNVTRAPSTQVNTLIYASGESNIGLAGTLDGNRLNQGPYAYGPISLSGGAGGNGCRTAYYVSCTNITVPSITVQNFAGQCIFFEASCVNVTLGIVNSINCIAAVCFDSATDSSLSVLNAINADPAAVVSTTSTTAVTSGSTVITPASMTGIVLNSALAIDLGNSVYETVLVTAVSGTTFTAYFANAHSGTWNITSAIFASDSALQYSVGVKAATFGQVVVDYSAALAVYGSAVEIFGSKNVAGSSIVAEGCWRTLWIHNWTISTTKFVVEDVTIASVVVSNSVTSATGLAPIGVHIDDNGYTSANPVRSVTVSSAVVRYAQGGAGIPSGAAYFLVASQCVGVSINGVADDGTTATIYRYPAVGFGAAGKNAIIDGGMDIWQRGTSFSPTGSTAYAADRWCAQSSASNMTISQGTASPPRGFKYFTKLVVTSTSSSTFYFAQSIESVNVIPLQGQVVTVSFLYKHAVTQFTNPVTLTINYSTGTDANLLNTGTAVTLTAGSNVNTSTGAIGSDASWTTGTVTFTVPATATSLAVQFSSATNVFNNAEFDITGVQLELGSLATPFSRAGGSIGGELALCQRYYYKMDSSVGSGTPYEGYVLAQCYSTTTAAAQINFPVPMRTSPSFTTSTVSQLALDSASLSAIACSSVAMNQYSSFGATLTIGVASGLAAGNASLLVSNNNNTSYLAFNAEL